MYTGHIPQLLFFFLRPFCYTNKLTVVLPTFVTLHFYQPLFLHRSVYLSSYVFMSFYFGLIGPGSSVDIATGYGLDGPGIESRWGEIFRRPDRLWGPPSLLYNGYRVFPGVKSGRGVTLTPHPLLVPTSKNRTELYLYSPSGPSWSIKKG